MKNNIQNMNEVKIKENNEKDVVMQQANQYPWFFNSINPMPMELR